MFTESDCVMMPNQLDVIQRVFKDITAETWFSRDPERVQKFGAFLVRAHQSGITDRVALHHLALRTARDRFSEPDS